MTTITREQQKQILIDTANHVISRDNTSPYSENLRELARIALASLESEPVAYIFKHPAGELFWSLTDESNKGQNDVMPVYAAPPAPVVPEECPEEIRDLMASHSDALFNDDDAQEIWNACRAAMLQGSQPVSNRDGLSSPVIPDGYALVPVEPTPEMREAFHVANEEYESGSYDVWKPDHQWQAMLAAAPQLKIALASIERCQAGFDAKHALFEVAIARFSKMNEGFPIKRFKADWVISWMLENFPPVAQKQGDN
ncbi:TPA: hypothetical protein ACWOS7_003427 [Salmonella enterica subsp. enterica]